MKQIKAKVNGMHCASCEILIERKLRNVPGVSKVKVSGSSETAEIESSDDINLEDLQNAVKNDGYSLIFKQSDETSKEQPDENSKSSINLDRFVSIGGFLLIILAAYLFFKRFDLIPANFGITENMSYGFVFVLGLIAATSTCLAVAGGLLLAVAAKHAERNPQATGWQKFRPHIFFNIGRIISYTLLGGLIGALGSVLALSDRVTGILIIIISILMVIIGLQLLNIFPFLNKFRIKMPKFIAHKIYSSTENKGSNSKYFLFGASTFFLPCGFTQALQLYVLGKGDFMTGALTMLAFSLGTLPSLAGIGAFSSFAKGNMQKHFVAFSAVLIIVLGFFNFSSGVTLTGASLEVPSFNFVKYNDLKNDNGEKNPVNQKNANIADGKQIVNMKIDGLDYYPSEFTVKENIPVEWHIDGTKAQGCAGVLSVPSLGIRESTSGNKDKVITFTPTTPGKIKFTCSMGMAGPGYFNVVSGN